MNNIFRIIDDVRWKYYRQFNNIIISEVVADEILKSPQMINAPISAEKCESFKYINGYIYGIPVIVDKYMPNNRLVFRNNDYVIAIFEI